MSLRRHFVPTAWLLCGLPLSLSFHMNATLACNAAQYRKLNVPNLNSATLGSKRNFDLYPETRRWPEPPHRSRCHKWASYSRPQQDANWQKPAGKTTARACPAPVPPALPGGRDGEAQNVLLLFIPLSTPLANNIESLFCRCVVTSCQLPGCYAVFRCLSHST